MPQNITDTRLAIDGYPGRLQVGYVAINGTFGDFKPFGKLTRGDKSATTQVLNNLEKAVCAAHGDLKYIREQRAHAFRQYAPVR
ncbi:hypothetical protein FQZ97_992320 [compost metagenome]